ncbi:protein JOKA2-like isoform X1 [Lycium ferocissimum]|uniref:protein JOKA2-like isoform X1 n=1 Tax=Lycium ferocissimum TaxID=112874 RepID=UPI0028164A27|nr:protein JOKA2-like isoform X1 [Lycium ferocissimum]
MESSIVIKVKYGETLRRFNVCVADDKLGLNMDGLREKIFQLFNFPLISELTLTYIDEDGDVVTLVDDEDLQDITRQDLNPLRISVRLNTDKVSTSGTSSGNSTPFISPLVQPTFPNINSSVSDFLKSLPETKSGKILKHSADMASKASSAAREMAEITKALSKTGISYLKQACPVSGVATGVIRPIDSAGCFLHETTSQALPSVKSGEPSPAANAEERTLKTAGQPNNHTGSIDASKLKSFQPDQNGTQRGSLSKSPKPNSSLADGKKVGKKFGDSHLVGKALGISYSSPSTTGPEKRADKQPSENHPGAQPVAAVGSASSNVAKMCWDTHNVGSNGSPSGMLFNGFRSPSLYPMTGLPLVKNTIQPQYTPVGIQLKRSHNHSDGAAAIFHRGVRCDGCGVHPITGPRFKSKVKEDYDLCSLCFAQMGNDADYIRMDRPVTYHHPIAFKGLHDPRDIFRGCGVKSPKLDSRFTLDVNVLDGTIMAPLTPFTKVWRMRNNGNIVWPQGTRLVWIGGDRLSDAFSVELQITSVGLAVDHELDVAVDFTAPELPGRYISYWRMALPSGQKFGQRVWVLIKVDAAMVPKKEFLYEAPQELDLNFPPASNGIGGSGTINVDADTTSQYLNLNFPPASIGIAGSETINVNADSTMEDIISEPKISDPTMELVEPVVDGNRNKERESCISPSAAGSSISNPIDLSEAAPAVASAVPPSVAEVQASSLDGGEISDVEMSLLKELEQMGFKQVDVNKKILRMNEYDLEQSVDDLCGVSEWDPILEELEEMGFLNKEMNKKLLKKNNGSIKRVVMDLIAGEN